MSVELCFHVCRDRGRLSQAEDEEWSLHPGGGERTLIRIIKTGNGQCFLCAFFILSCSWKFTLNQQQSKSRPKTAALMLANKPLKGAGALTLNTKTFGIKVCIITVWFSADARRC